jgi:hypothetical protein
MRSCAADVTLGKIAYALSILLCVVACCTGTGYFYEKNGDYDPNGNVFSLFSLLFTVHLIFTVIHIFSPQSRYTKLVSFNRFSMIWYFLYTLYFIFMSMIFHCDYALTTYLIMSLAQIFVGILYVSVKRKVLKSTKEIISDTMVLCYTVCFAQLLFFGLMTATSTPYKVPIAIINVQENTSLDVNLSVPINCISPCMSIKPDLFNANYELTTKQFKYFNTTPSYFDLFNTSDGFTIFQPHPMMHTISVSCGMNMINTRYVVGILTTYASNDTLENQTRLFISYDGYGDFALMCLPFGIMVLGWMCYAAVSMDYSSFAAYKKINEVHTLDDVSPAELNAFTMDTLSGISDLDPSSYFYPASSQGKS